MSRSRSDCLTQPMSGRTGLIGSFGFKVAVRVSGATEKSGMKRKRSGKWHDAKKKQREKEIKETK